MKKHLSLSINKHTDTLIEQTKTIQQETVEFKLNKQIEVFVLSTTIHFIEEGKCLSAVTSLEATNSVFNLTDENNRFSITISGH